MEIRITHLMSDEYDMIEFSASAAELGDNAGEITWQNAMDEASLIPLMTDDQLPEFRDYVRDFGTWDDEEINSWDSQEYNALLIQMVAGDIRERQHYIDSGREDEYAVYVAGRIYQSDNGDWYYYVGS